MRKLSQQPKRIGGWFYRKLPWYGKILIPLVALLGAMRVVAWIAELFI